MLASFVLSRLSRCGVAHGYGALVPLPETVLDSHFEHPVGHWNTSKEITITYPGSYQETHCAYVDFADLVRQLDRFSSTFKLEGA